MSTQGDYYALNLEDETALAQQLRKPDHPWNDPDKDGHNCEGCPVGSVWRCDEAAHIQRPSPLVAPVEGS